MSPWMVWMAAGITMAVIVTRRHDDLTYGTGMSRWKRMAQSCMLYGLVMLIWPIYLLAMLVPPWRRAWNL